MKDWTNCIRCKRGVNGDRSCLAGGLTTLAEAGCFLGTGIEALQEELS